MNNIKLETIEKNLTGIANSILKSDNNINNTDYSENTDLIFLSFRHMTYFYFEIAKQYNILLPEEDITNENFKSIKRMSLLIYEKVTRLSPNY